MPGSVGMPGMGVQGAGPGGVSSTGTSGGARGFYTEGGGFDGTGQEGSGQPARRSPQPSKSVSLSTIPQPGAGGGAGQVGPMGRGGVARLTRDAVAAGLPSSLVRAARDAGLGPEVVASLLQHPCLLDQLMAHRRALRTGSTAGGSGTTGQTPPPPPPTGTPPNSAAGGLTPAYPPALSGGSWPGAEGLSPTSSLPLPHSSEGAQGASSLSPTPSGVAAEVGQGRCGWVRAPTFPCFPLCLVSKRALPCSHRLPQGWLQESSRVAEWFVQGASWRVSLLVTGR